MLSLKTVFVLTFLSVVSALEDGDFYKISHPASGKVLTVGSVGPVDGAEIILKEWENNPNQKWLAVQAVVAGDNYLLLTQQQRWNWLHFIRNGEALRETKERHDSLPDWSLVLQGDPSKGVTVQPRDSRKYQQWRSETSGGFGKVIIRNIQENKCLQAPGVFPQGSTEADAEPNPKPGFFRRMRNWFSNLFGRGSAASTTTTATPTTMAPTTPTPNAASSPTSHKITLSPCDKANGGQQWTLELMSIR